jgi:hypothetical protein
MGAKAMLVPPHYITVLDPVAFNCLSAWFALKPEDIIPGNLLHPFN